MTLSTPAVSAAFAAVPHAAQIDCTELNRMPTLAIDAAARLDVQELKRLAIRVQEIAGRHPRNLRVLALVRRVGNAVVFQQRKAQRILNGSGL